MARKKKQDAFATEWESLHGYPWPRQAQKLAPAAAHELEGMRPAGLLDAPNVFEATIEATEGWRRLLLWGPFVNLVPMHSLGNGDVLHVYVASAAKKDALTGIVVWNHERDYLEAPAAPDLDGRPAGDTATPMRFFTRAAYIVEALVKGRFDLGLYTAFAHQVPDVNHPALIENIRAYPPTALYTMWHLFFARDDARLAGVLAIAADSPSRWIRDSAALVRQLQEGRNTLFAIKDVSALRDEAARVINDPATLARAIAAQRRAELDAFLASRPGLRLLRTERTGTACQPTTDANLPDGTQLTVTRSGHRVSLVLRRLGRALSAMSLSGDGGLPVFEPSFQIVGGKAALLHKRSDAKAPGFPRDGHLVAVALKAGRLVSVADYQFDIDGLERAGEELMVRTPDGARYRLEGEIEVGPDHWRPPIPPLPAVPAEPPVSGTARNLDGDEIELTGSTLRVLRGAKLLLEEPMIETYQCAVIPARRMVAVHRTGFDFRPVVDVFWVRPLAKPAKPGEGGVSWVAWPVDGLEIELRASNDSLFVRVDGQWREVDRTVLDAVPGWIQSRGWL